MSLGISSRMLTRMRSQVGELLPDTCVIYAPGGSINSFGELEAALTNAGTVACRLDPLKSRSGADEAAAQEVMVAEYVLTLPYNAPVGIDYRFVIGGDTYEVTTMADDHSWRVSRKLYVSRTD
jgi:hypothetical protein